MPSHLYAIGGNRSTFDLSVEDTVSVLMEYKNNENSFAVTLNMCFVQHSPVRRFQVFGENGSILWDISNNIIRLDDYVNNIFDECVYDNFERNNMFEDQMLHFIKSVKNKTKPITNLEDVVGSHRMAMNIKQIVADRGS
jgi:predicted dehydrogenase